MRAWMGAAWVAAAAALVPAAARAESADALVAQFFSIWDVNARVTPQAVASLYGRRVLYYGENLTTAQVYANKQNFIRRWPDRRYSVVPGTVSKGCAIPNVSCHVSVTLAWRARSDARGAAASGLTRVSLDLRQEDGTLKIVRESGSRVARLPGG